MKPKFTKKLAKEIAQEQFNWTLGCMIGTDDPDYDLETDVDELEQNFEETLESIGINPTPKRLEEIKSQYQKLVYKAHIVFEKLSKKTLLLDEYRKQAQIDKELVDINKQLEKEYKRQNERDKKVLKKIKEISSKEFYKDLQKWLKDEENGITGYYQVVDKPVGNYVKEKGYVLIKGMWVDQYVSPCIGDDYHGYLTIELENGKYLKCNFDLS